MKIKSLAVASILALSNPAFSDSFICRSDTSPGLDWEDGKWVIRNFSEYTLVARYIERGHADAGYCYDFADERIAEMGPSTAGYAFEARCYQIADLGQKTFAEPCTATIKNGEFFWLNCDNMTTFRMNDKMEFFRTSVYSALDTAPPEQQRDSVYVSIGKCSRID